MLNSRAHRFDPCRATIRRLDPLAKSEIAVRRAFHDGLASRQFEFAVEAHHHGVVAIAVDPKTEVRKPQLPVELGVSTARHIEVEMVLGLADNLDIQTAAACPKLLGHLS